MHYDGTKGVYQFPNCKSQICADVDDPSSNGGNPAVTYNKTSRMSYYTTGSGLYAWVINTPTGMETKFADLPAGHSYIIGLETISNVVYLFTVDEIYTAPVAPVPSVFTKVPLLSPPAVGVKLSTASIVDVNPATPNVVYFTGGPSPVASAIYTYRFVPEGQTSVIIQGFNQRPRQMYWSTSLNTVVVTNSVDVLQALDLQNGMPRTIVQTTPGTVASAIYQDYYYSANVTHATAQNIKAAPYKTLWCNKINGAPILGPFVYLA